MSYGELASREYKVMLNSDRFGRCDELEKAGKDFWSDLRRTGDESGLVELRKDPRWGKPRGRRISFWDTARVGLDSRDYLLRRRISDDGEGDEKKVSVTLKKRHADRVLAAHVDISTSDAARSGPRDGDLERKFEEDVKLTCDGRQRSLFSHSLTWKVRCSRGCKASTLMQLGNGAQVEALFPGLADAAALDGITPLQKVGGVEVKEYVLKVEEGRLSFADAPNIGIESALVAWYERSSKRQPAVVEFSFRYPGAEIDFNPAAAATAADLLQMMRNELSDWLSATDVTKTRWIYSQACPANA